MADEIAIELLRTARAILERDPDAGRLDVPELAKVSDGELYRVAKTCFEAGTPRIAPAVAVLVALSVEVGDMDAAGFWLRLLRAAATLEQVEPDPGAATH